MNATTMRKSDALTTSTKLTRFATRLPNRREKMYQLILTASNTLLNWDQTAGDAFAG